MSIRTEKGTSQNVKNKLYWESDDFAVSLGINFDEKRGTFALASENGERSNLSVHVLSKIEMASEFYSINPKVEYTAVFGGYGLRLTDDNIPFVMNVSFPTQIKRFFIISKSLNLKEYPPRAC